MTCEEALKNPDIYDLRLVSGDSWLYWDDTKNEWVVLSAKRYAKRSSVRYRGDSISDAIYALVA